MNGGTIRRVIWMEDWQDDWHWHDSEDCASECYDNENAYLGVWSCRLKSKFESAEQR